MKIVLQVFWHGLAAYLGFWLVSAEPISLPETPPQREKKSQRASLPAAPSSAAIVEQRMVELRPDNWPNAIDAISKMPLADLPVALRGILFCQFPDVRRRLVHCVFRRWAALDREGALAAMRGLSSPQMKAYALNTILEAWVKTDEASAWQWVTQMENDSVLQEAGIESLLLFCTEKNPPNYIAWAKELEDPFLRLKALDEIAQTWARKDPRGALEAAFAEENAHLRHQLLERTCYQDGSGIDRAQVLDRLLELPDKAERIRMIADDWIPALAQEKPEEALQWLVRNADRPELQEPSDKLGGIWAYKAKSIAELRTNALMLPPGALRDAFVARAADEWASSGHSIVEAEALLALCGPCVERDSALRQIENSRKQP